MEKTRIALLMILLLSVGAELQGAVINALPGAVSRPFSTINYRGFGPISENGFTWVSTYSSSVYGSDRAYGLSDNGYWEFVTFIGLNDGPDATSQMRITFDKPVSAVIAYLNHSAGADGTPYMAIYDESNTLIESHFLAISTPFAFNQGEDWGFRQSAPIIKSFVLGDAYIVAANLRTLDTTSVPEPCTLLVLGAGIFCGWPFRLPPRRCG